MKNSMINDNLFKVTIHPFRDGNGRTCRLLMDHFLRQAGYPPVIVPGNKLKKQSYYDRLNESNFGSDRGFVLYIVNLLREQIEVFYYLKLKKL
jgi:Fic family protein